MIVRTSSGDLSGRWTLFLLFQNPPPVSFALISQRRRLIAASQVAGEVLIIFLFLKAHKEKIPISDYNLPAELSYFKGITLNDLFKAEGNGTATSLTESGRLNFAITVDELSPFTMGQLFYLFEMVTMVMGMLMNINPFDQPGVEAYKKNMFALLGKPGFEAQRDELLKRLKK